MRLLVTGGAGFIGANFVNYWMRRHPEDEVTVVDKLTYAASMERLDEVRSSPRFRFIQADICDFNAMCEATKGIDVVVHFAAESHVDRSLSGLEAELLFNRTNLDGTITLLHAAYCAGVGRFHHVSTDEVFGDLDYDSSQKFHESFPYNPHNPYAISKAAADFAVRGFGRSHGLPFTISNCTNNYGPYQTPEKMIPRSIALLLRGEKIQLYANQEGKAGRNVRDWLHVEDHCSAIEAILLRGSVGRTYCVGGNEPLSNYELVERMLAIMSQIMGMPLSMERNVLFVKDRPGHDRRYAMDTRIIETELGWKRNYTFDEGLRSTVQWYLSDVGKGWLASLKNTADEVRCGQGSPVGSDLAAC